MRALLFCKGASGASSTLGMRLQTLRRAARTRAEEVKVGEQAPPCQKSAAVELGRPARLLRRRAILHRANPKSAFAAFFPFTARKDDYQNQKKKLLELLVALDR